jgi:hypothetical protein
MVETVFIPFATTIIIFLFVIFYNRRTASLKIGLKADKSERYPFIISMTILFFVIGTVWIFGWRGGIEDIKTIWSFLGPLMGYLIGYWLHHQQQGHRN